MGSIDRTEWRIAPLVGDWEQMPHQAWEARCMEVYAAMIDSMDQGIGRIVAEGLKRNRAVRRYADSLPARQRRLCGEGMGRQEWQSELAHAQPGQYSDGQR